MCDIWRSYWAQRLLWEMDASVMFVSGTVDQVRNAHDYVKDFRDEMQVGALAAMWQWCRAAGELLLGVL